jgi:hypothetical protein
MPAYRVSFYKTVLSSDGHCFKCLQQQIDVHESNDVTQATETASKAFANLHGMRDWKVYADSVEVTPADIVPQLRERRRSALAR